eukprot:TRINITY_DN10796_c0_g1_i1.p1 TRINITY_DN10796_c0_g1~~TRINITY_DN10796_c0_g1_i1.p1  ORF type:complete len:117 (-),score=42.05 TRINITY_DN10796_c0_g1_i1:151-501(-)
MNVAVENNKEEIENFLHSLQEFAPTIPDEVTRYYLQKGGFQCSDIRVQRLVGLAAQKFLTDLINESLQYAKIRQSQNKGKKNQKLALTMEDLTHSLKEYGINVKKPQYFIQTEEKE